MNKIYYSEGTLKKWLRKLRSPVSYFYGIDMKPETIHQEMMQSGKPVALYEKLLFHILFSLYVVLGLLNIVGVKWNARVGLVGLIVTGSFLIVEMIYFRLRSFSRKVKLARSVIFLFMSLVVMYFIQIAVKGS